MERSKAVQLAEDVLDAVRHFKGELTADGCRQTVGKSYTFCGDPDLGDFQCFPRGVRLAPKGEEFMNFTWSKFVKFCRENGLIEEESSKCNHKPAPKPAAAATMAGTAPQSAPIASDAQSSPCPSSGADVPTEEKTPLNSHCKTGKSPSGHCGAAAYCNEPYDCCAQCPNDCNSRCGWISAKEETVPCKTEPAQSAAAAATMAAPAVTPAAETSTTLESAADAAASTPKPSSPDAPTPLSAPASPAEAGAAAQSLSAAAPASLGAPAAFDYTGLDQPTADALRWAEREICDARRDYVARLAQAVHIAHDALVQNLHKQNNQHSDSTFVGWCESVGLNRRTAYNLLQVAALLNGSTPEEQAVLEAASPSLLYAAAKPSAPAQLVQAVKDGDITTHKQYQDLLAQLKAKEQELADKQAEWEADRAATSALLADEQQRRQEANEARIAAEKAARGAKESCRAAQDAAKAARQDAEAKASRIAELEARPIEVVGADPDEIERRANALAEEKTADLKVELSAEKARASQLEEQLEDVKEMAEQSSAAFAIGMARRLSDSCEEMLARYFGDPALSRVDYDTYEDATDILRELGAKLAYAIENGDWPDQWPIEYEEGPVE